ncbi:ATP-binding protein [Aquabacterium sp.]|uniref:ATP-binding protein n=1 Tax=Aquabacterium sp. TaxID=1872578 RepID=UPI0037840BBC
MRWFTDTLSRRLLLLMWGALVVSHLAAFAVVRLVVFDPGGPGPAGLPTLPSLPPTPGLPGGGPGPRAVAPGATDAPGGPPAGGLHTGRPGLPPMVLALDYGIRFVIIALAAWWGSRWLARPMRQLVQASQHLGGALGGSGPLPLLDEQRGVREVRDAARVFNTMARELREQFQSRGLMIAAISHDLRTPLTRLRMRLEEMPAAAGQQQRAVADVREMNELIDTVLEVFRPQGPGDAEAAKPVDVAALVQSLVDDLAEQGRPVTMAPGTPAVTKAQPAALRRVVANLIGNALRYGERAEVRVAQMGDELCITIDDAGPGIPPEELERVFRPFYRVDASRNRHTGGTGLGLYIARELLQRQQGRLLLSNRPKGGLRAELRLPRR